MAKTILLFVPDLMFETRIADTARRIGYAVESVNAFSDASNKIANANLVMLGLENNHDWQAVVEQARASRVPVLAFGRHTSAEMLKHAREAGCARVVVNSDIAEKLPQLLEDMLGVPTSNL